MMSMYITQPPIRAWYVDICQRPAPLLRSIRASQPLRMPARQPADILRLINTTSEYYLPTVPTLLTSCRPALQPPTQDLGMCQTCTSKAHHPMSSPQESAVSFPSLRLRFTI